MVLKVAVVSGQSVMEQLLGVETYKMCKPCTLKYTVHVSLSAATLIIMEENAHNNVNHHMTTKVIMTVTMKKNHHTKVTKTNYILLL